MAEDTTSATELERLVVRLTGESSQYDKMMDNAAESLKKAEKTLLEAASAVEAKQDEMLSEAARLFASTRTPMENYNQELAKMRRMYDAGFISAEMYNRASRNLHSNLPQVQAAQAKLNAEVQQGRRITQEAATQQEIYGQKMTTLFGHLARGTISQETYDRSVQKLRKSLADFNRENGLFGKNMEMVGQKMRSAGLVMSVGVTAPVVALGAAASKEFTKYEDGLLMIQASAGPTADEMAKLDAQAMKLSADLRMDPTQILAGYSELLKAGVSLEKVMGETGDETLKFAKVGELETARAATVMADSMYVFNKSAKETGDTLSGAADASSVSIPQIVDAFSQVSAVAAQTNQSLLDTSAAIALLGKNGVKGSDAGTSLKTMLLRLMAPVDKGAKVFEKYNLQIRNVDGTMKPLVGIIAELQAKFGDLDQVAKDRVLADLFGQDAIRAGSIFLKEGVAGIEDFTRQIQNANTVSAKYTTLMSGMSGKMAATGASFSRFKIELGRSVTEAFAPFFNMLMKVLDTTKAWMSENKTLTSVLVGVAAAAATVGPALLGIGGVLAILPQVVNGFKLVNAAMIQSRALALSLKAGMVGLAIGGMMVLWKTVYDNNENIKEFNKQMERSIELANKLKDATAARGQETIDTAAKMKDPGQRSKFLLNAVQQGSKELNGMNDAVLRAEEDVMKLDTAWNRMTGNKELEAAKQQAEQLNKRLVDQKLHVTTLQKLWNQAQDAMRKGPEAAKTTAKAGAPPTALTDAEEDISPLQKYMAVQAELKTKLENSVITLKEFKRRMKEAKSEFNAKDTDPVRQLTRDLEAEVAMFKMSAEEKQIYKMSQLGATEAQLKEARAMQAKLKVMDEEKKATEKATQLAEKYMTPREKFKKTEKELTDLLNRELISVDAFNQEMKSAREELTKEVKIDFSVTGVEAVKAGSAEALAAVEQTRMWADSALFGEAQRSAAEQLAKVSGPQAEQTEPRFSEPSSVRAVAKAETPKVQAEHETRVESLLSQIAENTRKGESVVLEDMNL